MGTIVGVRLADGVALAADERATSEGSVRSERLEKLFGFDDAGAAAVGEAGAIQTFGRKLESEVRSRETEQGKAIGIDPLSRLASDLAGETGIEAVVAARDGDGIARLRAVDAAGGELDEEVAARGTGAELALGQLDGMDREQGVEGADDVLESVFGRIAERDTETGSECEVRTLPDA